MYLFASRTSLSTFEKTGPYILNRNPLQGKTVEVWALLDPFSELHRKKHQFYFGAGCSGMCDYGRWFPKICQWNKKTTAVFTGPLVKHPFFMSNEKMEASNWKPTI